MASLLSRPDRTKLFHEVYTMLGYPFRDIKSQLEESTLETLFTIALEDYCGMLSAWLVQQQWGSLQGAKIDDTNFIFALSTKTLDFEHSFTHAYSKQAGVGVNSPWELKKDFVELEAGRQVYTIPAGREVNEVLWSTPSQIATVGSVTAPDWIAAPFGWNVGGYGAEAVLPTYGLLLAAQDRTTKKTLLQSAMSYRIVGGPNGTRQLFLYPVPGSRDEMKGPFGTSQIGQKVWYFYYETNTKGRKKCLEANDDIVRLPDEVPQTLLKWEKLNLIAKTRIRKLLAAAASDWIGKIRGTFKGEILGLEEGTSRTMDYEMYLTMAKDYRAEVMEEINEYLKDMAFDVIMEKRAKIAQSLNDVLKFEPMPAPFRMI